MNLGILAPNCTSFSATLCYFMVGMEKVVFSFDISEDGKRLNALKSCVQRKEINVKME